MELVNEDLLYWSFHSLLCSVEKISIHSLLLQLQFHKSKQCPKKGIKMEQVNRNFSYCTEFFKVFLSNCASHQLTLPQSFIKQVNGIIPENVTLKDYTGKLWNVELQKVEKNVAITFGWKDFATFHALIDGDFLIFKYDGHSHFDVELYDKKGLKKAKALAPVKEEQEIEERHIGSWRTARYNCKDPEIAPTRTQRTGCSSRGSQPNLCKNARKPKHLCFEVNVTPKKRYVYVPRSLIKDHEIKLKRYIELCDENGKLWPVKVTLGASGRIIFCSGWPRFLKQNKLEVGDKCIFELILTGNNECSAMQVQIVRKGLGSQNCRRLQRP